MTAWSVAADKVTGNANIVGPVLPSASVTSPIEIVTGSVAAQPARAGYHDAASEGVRLGSFDARSTVNGYSASAGRARPTPRPG